MNQAMPGSIPTAMGLVAVSALVATARTIVVGVVTDWVLVGTLVTVVVVGLLVVSAAMFPRRKAWARMVVLVWSVISAISSALTLLARLEPWWYLLSAAITLACAGALVVLLLRPEARDWFEQG